MLAARRLPSRDIIIITDRAETKEQLEQDNSWLLVVGQAVQVNRRKFIVIAYSMRMAALDYSK